MDKLRDFWWEWSGCVTFVAVVFAAAWVGVFAVQRLDAECPERWKDSGYRAEARKGVCMVEVSLGRWVPEANVRIER